jgi:hypothetical protein
MFVARNLRYSSSLGTEKSACKKVTFLVLGCFPIVLSVCFVRELDDGRNSDSILARVVGGLLFMDCYLGVV